MAYGGHYKTPPLFSESKPYTRWVDEVRVWQIVTDLDETKQGPAIALSLPENEGTVRDKVFSELGVDKLKKKDGVTILIAFLDKIYKKDELSAAYETYTDFDRFKRNTQMPMEHYVTEFEKLYNKTQKYQMALPESILAFKLLDGAALDHKDRQLVLTGVSYDEKDTLFKQMSISLRKFFGKQSMPCKAVGPSVDSVAVKVEPVCVADTEEESAFYSGARFPRGGRGRGVNRGRWRGQGTKFQNFGANSGYGTGTFGRRYTGTNNKPRRPTNPLGPDGNPLKCRVCESIFHFIRDCPDSYENRDRQMEGKDEEAVLFTGNQVEEMQTLVTESINAAVLDSACSSTVAGKTWMDCYLDSLTPEKQKEVIKSDSDTVFKFGGGTRLKSKGKVTFPCEIAGVKCRMTSDIVDSDIPLLLGKPAMKAAKAVLDLENDKALLFGKNH